MTKNRLSQGQVKALMREDLEHDDTQIGADAVKEAGACLEELARNLGAFAEQSCRNRDAKRVGSGDVVVAWDRLVLWVAMRRG